MLFLFEQQRLQAFRCTTCACMIISAVWSLFSRWAPLTPTRLGGTVEAHGKH